MELKVNGFSHKLPLLLVQLVKALVSLKVGNRAHAMALLQLPASSTSLACPLQLLLADLTHCCWSACVWTLPAWREERGSLCAGHAGSDFPVLTRISACMHA
jgi:hypothetical protein